MATKTYDADQVVLVVAGVPINSGFSDGEFLRIVNESDSFTDKAGVDGEVTRSKTNDFRGTITVILGQTSDHNQLFSTLINLDRTLPNGGGMFPVSVKDLQSQGTVAAGVEAWFVRDPDAAYGRESSDREWTIRVGKLGRFDAGT